MLYAVIQILIRKCNNVFYCNFLNISILPPPPPQYFAPKPLI